MAVDDFNHAIDSGYYTDGFFGSPTAVGTPLYQGRNPSLEINSPGNEGVRHNYAGGTTRGRVGFPFRTPAFPTGGDTRLLTISSAGDLAECSLYVTEGGSLLINVGANFTPNVGISIDTFYFIEVIFDVSTTTYTATWEVDGVSKTGVSSGVLGSASTCDYNQLLSFTGEGTMTWYAGGYWEYDVVSSGTDFLGAPSGVEMQSYYTSRQRAWR